MGMHLGHSLAHIGWCISRNNPQGDEYHELPLSMVDPALWFKRRAAGLTLTFTKWSCE